LFLYQESGAKANVSALPKEPPVNKDSNKSGRLITIPLHILNKIDTKSPFALKLNNETFKVDPSRLIRTENGKKIPVNYVSRHYRLSPDSTDCLQTLQTVSRLYRLSPDSTDCLQTLQTVSRLYRLN